MSENTAQPGEEVRTGHLRATHPSLPPLTVWVRSVTTEYFLTFKFGNIYQVFLFTDSRLSLEG